MPISSIHPTIKSPIDPARSPSVLTAWRMTIGLVPSGISLIPSPSRVQISGVVEDLIGQVGVVVEPILLGDLGYPFRVGRGLTVSSGVARPN